MEVNTIVTRKGFYRFSELPTELRLQICKCYDLEELFHVLYWLKSICAVSFLKKSSWNFRIHPPYIGSRLTLISCTIGNHALMTHPGRVFELICDTCFVWNAENNIDIQKTYSLVILGSTVSLLSTNRESRNCALNEYTHTMKPNDDGSPPSIPFNCSKDVFLIRCWESMPYLQSRSSEAFLKTVKFLAIDSELIKSYSRIKRNFECFENLEIVFVLDEENYHETRSLRGLVKEKLSWTASRHIKWNKDFNKYHVVYATDKKCIFRRIRHVRWTLRHPDYEYSGIEIPFTCKSSRCSW